MSIQTTIKTKTEPQTYEDVISDLIPDLLHSIKHTDSDNVRQIAGSITELPTYYKRMRLITAKFIKQRKDGSFYVTLIGKEVAASFLKNYPTGFTFGLTDEDIWMPKKAK